MRPELQRAQSLVKRWQRRLYTADYREAELRPGWTAPDPTAPWQEQIVPIEPDPATIRSLLVFKPDEIGDAVYALPAVAELRRAFPQARIHLLCQRLTHGLYERSGLFDEIAAVSPTSRLGRARIPTDEALAGLSARSFDMSVYLRTYSATFPDFRAIPATIRVHPVDPLMRSDSVYRADISLMGRERRHQSLMLLEIVSRVSGRSYDFSDVVFPEFQWTDEDREAPSLAFGDENADRARPYVVVHPFAKHETREYPRESWHELLRRLTASLDATFVVVGGPEDPRLDEIPGVIQTQGRLKLSQTGYLMSRAAGFIGVLSGPAHWSGALGTPTVTLMSGHSLPVEWAPLGRSLVLRCDVPCAPCHQPTCPVYGLACLTGLTPTLVAPAIEEFLASSLAAGAA
jgi:ADP-heptose:LPS heptosyltransferase